MYNTVALEFPALEILDSLAPPQKVFRVRFVGLFDVKGVPKKKELRGSELLERDLPGGGSGETLCVYSFWGSMFEGSRHNFGGES